MRTRLIGSIAIAALALAACGGDDDGGGGGGSPQDQVADMMISSINSEMAGEDVEGVSIDEDCIRDKAGDLSDDDANAILAAGPEGEADVSPEAAALGLSLLDCIDLDLGELDLDLGDLELDG